MTRIYSGVTILTFDEWIKKHEVIKYLSETVDDCATCDGSGEHECECGHAHTCLDCDGIGTAQDYRAIYEKDLRDEIKKLTAWKEKVLSVQGI